MELFRLWGSILIDNKEAIKELDLTEKKVKDSQKAMSNLSDGAAKLGKAVVAGAAVAAGGLIALGTKAMNTASDISDASKRVGMSAEEYQQWTYAAKQSGIEADKLEAIMKKQQTAFANATEGNKTAAEAYQKLGINIKGLTAGDAFNQAIAALAGMTDETQRNSLANDLFGKSYADLAPLLGEGASGIAALKQEAVDLGMVMSNDTVAAGDQLGDTVDKLKGAFDGILNQLGASLIPIVQDLADKILENKDTIEAWITAGFDVLNNSLTWLGDNLNWIIPLLTGMAAAFVAFKIISFVSGLITTFSALTTGATTVMGIFNAVMAANPIMLMALAIGILIGAIALLWMNWDKVSKFLGSSFKSLGNLFIGLVNIIIGGVNTMIKAFLNPFNLLIKGFNATIGKLTGKIPEISVEIPMIPKLAKGGIAYGNSLVNVGEYPNVRSNPEVIAPLDKLQSMLSLSIDYDTLAEKIAQANRNFVIVLDKEQVGEFVDSRILKGAY